LPRVFGKQDLLAESSWEAGPTRQEFLGSRACLPRALGKQVAPASQELSVRIMVCPLTVLFSFPFCPVLSCPALSCNLSCPVLSCHLSCPVTCPVLSPVLSCHLSCPVHFLSPIVHVTFSYISCTAPMKYSIKFEHNSSRATLGCSLVLLSFPQSSPLLLASIS
jgi:hypothetical protein